MGGRGPGAAGRLTIFSIGYDVTLQNRGTRRHKPIIKRTYCVSFTHIVTRTSCALSKCLSWIGKQTTQQATVVVPRIASEALTDGDPNLAIVDFPA